MPGRLLKKQRIGLIAGSGPEAGIDLWQKILEANREISGAAFTGDVDAPDIVIVSESRLGLSMNLEAFEEEVWDSLESCVREVAAMTNYFAIACNTLHHFAPRIAELGLAAPLISITDVVDRHLQSLNGAEVTLLGSASIMRLGAQSPYAQLARRYPLYAPEELIPAVHELIGEVKRVGGSALAVVERFQSILDVVKTPVVLLACTELPLIPVEAWKCRPIDANRLLAVELVAGLRQRFREEGGQGRDSVERFSIDKTISRTEN